MARQYNDPAGDSFSSIDGDAHQMNEFLYQKKALIEARREQHFLPLASVVGMPKHFGKEIRRHYYIPLLDDANVNDQGIDAGGVTSANGNLYGSSKDIGNIPGKFPTLTEVGGRVNRVGFKRREIVGSIEKYGFFTDFTQESIDFDSDADLMMHVNREMLNGAHEITEDMLQIDLINYAGVVKWPGAATQLSEVDDTEISYRDLLRLSIDLDMNRTPKRTKLFTGTRMIDTKTIPGSRVLYMGAEMQPMMEEMKDLHQERAFIPVQQYAAGGTVLNGEIGSIGYFRIVIVPEMMNYTGAGDDSTGNTTHYSTGNQYDVFPMLVIGEESFTTIGFQTDGKTFKFKIIKKMPGEGVADLLDPYGEKGFMSIKWYYGFMPLRSERLAVVYSSAKM